MAGIALSVGEAGLAELVVAGFARLEAGAAEPTAAVGTLLAAGAAHPVAAAFAARKALVTNAGFTPIAVPDLVGRNCLAAVGAVASGPFFELSVGAFGVV